jgi:hypothetical protein
MSRRRFPTERSHRVVAVQPAQRLKVALLQGQARWGVIEETRFWGPSGAARVVEQEAPGRQVLSAEAVGWQAPGPLTPAEAVGYRELELPLPAEVAAELVFPTAVVRSQKTELRLPVELLVALSAHHSGLVRDPAPFPQQVVGKPVRRVSRRVVQS